MIFSKNYLKHAKREILLQVNDHYLFSRYEGYKVPSFSKFNKQVNRTITAFYKNFENKTLDHYVTFDTLLSVIRYFVDETTYQIFLNHHIGNLKFECQKIETYLKTQTLDFSMLRYYLNLLKLDNQNFFWQTGLFLWFSLICKTYFDFVPEIGYESGDFFYEKGL